MQQAVLLYEQGALDEAQARFEAVEVYESALRINPDAMGVSY